jgi:hypothetical protein
MLGSCRGSGKRSCRGFFSATTSAEASALKVSCPVCSERGAFVVQATKHNTKLISIHLHPLLLFIALLLFFKRSFYKNHVSGNLRKAMVFLERFGCRESKGVSKEWVEEGQKREGD